MLKKVCNFIICLLLAGGLLLSAAGTGLAAGERGSICVTMGTDEGERIPGGELTLYYVAYPALNGAGWYFHPTKGFENCKNLDLTELDAEGLEEKLEDYIKTQKNLPKIVEPIDKNGQARFDVHLDGTAGLEQGLYLVVQTKAAKGFDPIHSFLVTVPYDGEYDVDAKPKFVPPDAAKPDKPEPPRPGKPGRPGKPPLIQTGQLNWPVPVMAGAGVLLFTLGWVLVFGKRDRHGS